MIESRDTMWCCSRFLTDHLFFYLRPLAPFVYFAFPTVPEGECLAADLAWPPSHSRPCEKQQCHKLEKDQFR